MDSALLVMLHTRCVQTRAHQYVLLRGLCLHSRNSVTIRCTLFSPKVSRLVIFAASLLMQFATLHLHDRTRAMGMVLVLCQEKTAGSTRAASAHQGFLGTQPGLLVWLSPSAAGWLSLRCHLRSATRRSVVPGAICVRMATWVTKWAVRL